MLIRRLRPKHGGARAALCALGIIGLSAGVPRAQAPGGAAPDAAPAATAPAAESTGAPSSNPDAGVAAAPGADVTAAAPKPAAKPADPEPALTPYSVLVRLHVPQTDEIDKAFRTRLLSALASDLRTSMAQMWTTLVELPDDGRYATADALHDLTPAELIAQFGDAAFDKVIFAGVTRSGSCWSLATREWDASGRTAGPVYRDATCDTRLVAPLIAGLVRQAFRPIARIEDVDGALVVAAARAGEFPPDDPAATPFKPGDLLIPYVRSYDKERKLQQIRDLPWTYVRVKTVERARLECETVSAYRTPLSGSRRRMEIYVIAARPTFASTRLVIAPRGDASDPLPGCRVELLYRLPTADDPVDDRLKLLTDRRGAIVVDVDPARPLRYVLVHSGKAVLGRVPFIPGLVETATLAIPDDSARLSVEGALSVLEGELIDAVSRRSVLMARARRAAKARKWDDVDAFLQQLQSVPDYEAFRERVAAVQVPAVQAAKELNDRVAESRIKKMCADLQQSASGHLDADKIREFRIEMAELKQAAK